jgi:hypothetical protein
MADATPQRELGTWPLLGLIALTLLWAGIILRHIIFYDEFAELSLSQGLPAPPPFPIWQRITYGIIAGIGGLSALGLAFRRGWSISLFIVVFVIGQTFAFAIGQWGVASFVTGLAVVILGMNFLHQLK